MTKDQTWCLERADTFEAQGRDGVARMLRAAAADPDPTVAEDARLSVALYASGIRPIRKGGAA